MRWRPFGTKANLPVAGRSNKQIDEHLEIHELFSEILTFIKGVFDELTCLYEGFTSYLVLSKLFLYISHLLSVNSCKKEENAHSVVNRQGSGASYRQDEPTLETDQDEPTLETDQDASSESLDRGQEKGVGELHGLFSHLLEESRDQWQAIEFKSEIGQTACVKHFVSDQPDWNSPTGQALLTLLPPNWWLKLLEEAKSFSVPSEVSQNIREGANLSLKLSWSLPERGETEKSGLYTFREWAYTLQKKYGCPCDDKLLQHSCPQFHTLKVGEDREMLVLDFDKDWDSLLQRCANQSKNNQDHIQLCEMNDHAEPFFGSLLSLLVNDQTLEKQLIQELSDHAIGLESFLYYLGNKQPAWSSALGQRLQRAISPPLWHALLGSIGGMPLPYMHQNINEGSRLSQMCQLLHQCQEKLEEPPSAHDTTSFEECLNQLENHPLDWDSDVGLFLVQTIPPHLWQELSNVVDPLKNMPYLHHNVKEGVRLNQAYQSLCEYREMLEERLSADEIPDVEEYLDQLENHPLDWNSDVGHSLLQIIPPSLWEDLSNLVRPLEDLPHLSRNVKEGARLSLRSRLFYGYRKELEKELSFHGIKLDAFLEQLEDYPLDWNADFERSLLRAISPNLWLDLLEESTITSISDPIRRNVEAGANASMQLCWPFLEQEGANSSMMAQTSREWDKIFREECKAKGLPIPSSNTTMMSYPCPRLKTSLTMERCEVIFDFDKAWDKIWEKVSEEHTHKNYDDFEIIENSGREVETKYILDKQGQLNPVLWTSPLWPSALTPTPKEMGQRVLNAILIAKLEAIA